MSTIVRFSKTEAVAILTAEGKFVLLVQGDNKKYYSIPKNTKGTLVEYETVEKCIQSLGITIFTNVCFGKRRSEYYVYTYYGASWFPIGRLSSLRYRDTSYYWVYQDFRSEQQTWSTDGNISVWFTKEEDAMNYIHNIKLHTGLAITPPGKPPR
jgi:hypothetical protein